MKLAGRDALLVQQGGAVRCTTGAGERQLAEPPAEPPATGPEDCYRAMRIVDRAYDNARRGTGAPLKG